jgi:hypothetical protein
VRSNFKSLENTKIRDCRRSKEVSCITGDGCAGEYCSNSRIEVQFGIVESTLVSIEPNHINYVNDGSSNNKLTLRTPTSITKVPQIITRGNNEMSVDEITKPAPNTNREMTIKKQVINTFRAIET